MINKLKMVFKTDSLPVVGGGFGAFSQTPKLIPWLPTWEVIISTIIITMIGAIVGYLVKLLLDRIFIKPKERL
jgi:phosphate/sulfate permease